MLAILNITAPIYIIIALGYMSVRFGLFQRSDMQVLGRFVLYVALPALLFDSLTARPLMETLHVDYVLIYALGSLATMGLMGLWFARLARPAASQPAALAAVQTMGSMCSNSGFVGYPVALMVLGPTVAGSSLGMNMVVENLLLIPLLLAWMDAAQGHGAGKGPRETLLGVARQLVRNPMMIALLAGVLVSISPLALPEAAQRSVGLFARASSAVSLFVIGGSLAGLSVAGMRWQVLQIALGKLLVHPLLMWAALLAVQLLGAQLDMPPLAPELRTALLLVAACPMFGIYPILAQRQGHEGLAAAALLVTTALSFFTISALLWLLGAPAAAG